MRNVSSPRHYNDLASESQRKYGYDFVHFKNHARANDVPLYAPSSDFLEQYLEDEARISLNRACKRMRAIGYAFWKQGLPDPTLDLPIRFQIHQLRTEDRRQRLDLLGIPVNARTYAAYYAHGYASASEENFRRREEGWTLWASRHGIKPKRPTPDELTRFLRTFDHNGFGHIANIKRALQVYFQRRHLPDVTQSAEVTNFLEAMRRKKKDSVEPAFIDHVRRICSILSDDLLDRRDHLAVLFAYFGPLSSAMQSELYFAHVLREDDGVTVTVRGRNYFIDRFSECEALDIVAAYDKYVERIPWREGRFFRGLGLRGEFLTEISPGSISMAIANAAKRAGVRLRSATRSLARGARAELVRCFGTILAAHRLGMKKPASLGRHSAQTTSEVNALRRRGKGWRGATPRGRRHGQKRTS